MEMLNLICKKDFVVESNDNKMPNKIAYKAGEKYVFFRTGDKYYGFDENQRTKREMSKELMKEHFLKEALGTFCICKEILETIFDVEGE